MDPAKTARASVGNMRVAGYFAWFIAAIVGLHAIAVSVEEYSAQHRWPVAAGDVISVDEKSVRLGSSSSPTQYLARFTIEFDPPLEQCGEGMLVVWVGGPTRCSGILDTPPGSSDSTYQWMLRHPRGSKTNVHYQPYGSGLRFAGESIANIYPWREVGITMILWAVGFGIIRFGRKQEQLAVDSPASRNDSAEASENQELIDLNLR
jgi:hypothetical protein